MSKKWRPGVSLKELEDTLRLIVLICDVNSRYTNFEYYKEPHEILSAYKNGLKDIRKRCKKILNPPKAEK